MAVDGTYELEIETPIGTQSAKLTLKTDSNALSGFVESQLGNKDFSGGSVNGDEISCEMEIESPIGKMDLEFHGKVTGDDIAGEVKMGDFGSSPFKGKRV